MALYNIILSTLFTTFYSCAPRPDVRAVRVTAKNGLERTGRVSPRITRNASAATIARLKLRQNGRCSKSVVKQPAFSSTHPSSSDTPSFPLLQSPGSRLSRLVAFSALPLSTQSTPFDFYRTKPTQKCSPLPSSSSPPRSPPPSPRSTYVSYFLNALGTPAELVVFQTTAPVDSTTWAANAQQTISWQDDGAAPSLKDFGVSKVSVYVGNQQQQVSSSLFQSRAAEHRPRIAGVVRRLGRTFCWNLSEVLDISS